MSEAPRDWMPEIVAHLENEWGVAEADLREPSDWDRVLDALTERVGHLLKYQPDRVASAMYLLDIRERDFAQALEQPSHEDRAHALALVIMNRETEKIRTRRQYKDQRIEGGG